MPKYLVSLLPALPQRFISLLAVLFTTSVLAQYPSTDIFVADLKVNGKKIEVSNLKNITTSSEYDNQPCFTSDSKAILFSSLRDKQQVDIYRYTVATEKTELVCNTPESEFSPTPTPDNDGYSTVRIDKDSSQHLWFFNWKSCAPELVFKNIDSIGYYGWIDPRNIALFRITEPSSLVLAEPGSDKTKPVMTNVGRCIRKVPKENAFSFIQKIDSSLWVLREYSLETKKFSFICQSLRASEDYEWLPGKLILMGQGSKLMMFDASGAECTWVEVADLGTSIERISRITVSPNGKKIAFSGFPKLGSK